MKKGDLKRGQILDAAEKLFFERGYDRTSIQDILDDLHTSKGSFYHHFTSKESLLEAICKERAESSRGEILQAVSPDAGAVEILNALISGVIPFSGEKLSFLLMILPVFNGPEGIRLKAGYTAELSAIYLQPVADALKKGTGEGSFSCSDPVFDAGLELDIIHRYWLNICEKILRDHAEDGRTDASELLELTEQYRTALERMLSAPYGSISLIRLPELKSLVEQIHLHLQVS